MRKNKRLLSYGDRSDRNLFFFTAAVAVVVCVVIYIIPSGLDDEWIDHSQLHSSSLLQRMESQF